MVHTLIRRNREEFGRILLSNRSGSAIIITYEEDLDNICVEHIVKRAKKQVRRQAVERRLYKRR